MGFVQDAESIRAKAHATDIPRPVIAGVALAALVVVVLAVSSAASAIGIVGDAGFTLEKNAEDPAASQASDGGGEDGATDEGGEQGAIVVHVTGSVASPGVYELAQGARVQAAVDAAGGFADGADVSAVNCARVAQDGEQIFVPSIDASPAGATDVGGEGGASEGSATGGGESAKVNINRADAAELDTLPGVGPSTAEKIIADREANGPFATIEDIKRVSGIGDKKYEQLAGLICV